MFGNTPLDKYATARLKAQSEINGTKAGEWNASDPSSVQTGLHPHITILTNDRLHKMLKVRYEQGIKRGRLMEQVDIEHAKNERAESKRTRNAHIPKDTLIELTIDDLMNARFEASAQVLSETFEELKELRTKLLDASGPAASLDYEALWKEACVQGELMAHRMYSQAATPGRWEAARDGCTIKTYRQFIGVNS